MSNQQTSKKAANNTATILSAICETGSSNLGRAINRDASFITRFKSNEKSLTLGEFATLLTACDLEVTHSADESVTIDKILHQAMIELANRGLKDLADHSITGPDVTITAGLYSSLKCLSGIALQHLRALEQ